MTRKTRQRKCLVTREVCEAADLIRFVCAPSGDIIPDVAAKLPGRGGWVKADREIIEQAIARKIFVRFGHQVLGSNKKKDVEELEDTDKATKGGAVKVREDLMEQIETLLLKRCLDHLGLASKAGNVLSGFEKVRAALKSGKTNILVTASDGAENGRSKMCQGLDNLQVIDMFARDDLSRAIGNENAVHLALLPGGIRTSLLREISRYERCRKKVIK